MKRKHFALMLALVMVVVLASCAAPKQEKTPLTAEQAFQGVDAYCRETYDWSYADEHPEAMYVALGEETETEFEVIFRSYTGSFVYFYVDKDSGETRLEEYVPALDLREDGGTINVNDYLK